MGTKRKRKVYATPRFRFEVEKGLDRDLDIWAVIDPGEEIVVHVRRRTTRPIEGLSALGLDSVKFTA